MNPLRNLWYTITGQTPPSAWIQTPEKPEEPVEDRHLTYCREESKRTGVPLAEVQRIWKSYPGIEAQFYLSEPSSKEERRLASDIAKDLLDKNHRDAHNITTLAQWLISTRTPQAETTWQARRDRAADDIQLLNNLRYTLDLTEEQTAKINTAIDHIRAKHGLGNF